MGGPAVVNKRRYYEFDNFNMRYPFLYNEKEWMSVEQLYQAMKFVDEKYREYIRAQRSPHLIYMLGQDRTKQIVPNLDKVKTDHMYTAMKTRISQYPELQDLLLETDDDLIEYPGSDNFWGTSGGRYGENWNGKILMRIRKELKNEK